jgi:hypothetical protein
VELQLSSQVMFEDQILESAEFNCRVAIAWIKNSSAIRGFSRLFQQQEKLEQAGLSRAVPSEEDSDRGKTDLSRILPGFEIFDS